MAAKIIDGKRMAEASLVKTTEKVADFQRRTGRTPGLTVILVGDDPSSQIYVRNKEKACERTGIHGETYRLPADVSQQELEELIARLNGDETVDGILVQLPLPAGLDEKRVLALVSADKDVDGFHAVNMGRLLLGEEGTAPCTPKGAMEMIRSTGVRTDGLEAVVVGRSNIVGKPMAAMLLKANCTVTQCHSRTADLAAHTRRADILVAAVGVPRMITADMVKEDAIVIDVGINRVDGHVVGDVDFEAVSEKAGWITPVPGGVGRMTIAMLMENTLEAAERNSRQRE